MENMLNISIFSKSPQDVNSACSKLTKKNTLQVRESTHQSLAVKNHHRWLHWRTTLPETNIAMENPPFWWYLLGKMGIFMGYVSFREGNVTVMSWEWWKFQLVKPHSQVHRMGRTVYLLGQWLNGSTFNLFGITYLVGKIKFKPFISGFHWPSEVYLPTFTVKMNHSWIGKYTLAPLSVLSIPP